MTNAETHRFEQLLRDKKAKLVRALRTALDRPSVDLTEQELVSQIVGGT